MSINMIDRFGTVILLPLLVLIFIAVRVIGGRQAVAKLIGISLDSEKSNENEELM